MDQNQLRKVVFPEKLKDIVECGGKGFFHRWVVQKEEPFALVEAKDGTMRMIHARHIQFKEYYYELKEKMGM